MPRTNFPRGTLSPWIDYLHISIRILSPDQHIATILAIPGFDPSHASPNPYSIAPLSSSERTLVRYYLNYTFPRLSRHRPEAVRAMRLPTPSPSDGRSATIRPHANSAPWGCTWSPMADSGISSSRDHDTGTWSWPQYVPPSHYTPSPYYYPSHSSTPSCNRPVNREGAGYVWLLDNASPGDVRRLFDVFVRFGVLPSVGEVEGDAPGGLPGWVLREVAREMRRVGGGFYSGSGERRVGMGMGVVVPGGRDVVHVVGDGGVPVRGRGMYERIWEGVFMDR